VLKRNAVGWDNNPLGAPIDKIHLAGRLMTAPSIMQFYLTKLVFPWKLASAYFWTYPTFSIKHFLVPLMVDLAVIGLVVYLTVIFRKKLSKAKYFTYLFFAIWAFGGLIPYLQIIPIDMTVCESWFYFSMIGFLGMIGIVLVSFQSRLRPSWFLIIAVLVIGSMGIRTALRGTNWRTTDTMAFKDAAVSPGDYIADKNIAYYYYDEGNFAEAKVYADRSVTAFPGALSYNILGMTLLHLNNYPGAAQAYDKGMQYSDLNLLYENRASLTGGYGSAASNTKFLLTAVNKFPKDAEIWFYFAIQLYRDNDTANAKNAITQSYKYAATTENMPLSNQDISVIYSRIMTNEPLNVSFNPNSPQ